MNNQARWRAAEIQSLMRLDSQPGDFDASTSETPTPGCIDPDDHIWPFDTDGEPLDGSLITETLSSDRYEVQS